MFVAFYERVIYVALVVAQRYAFTFWSARPIPTLLFPDGNNEKPDFAVIRPKWIGQSND